MSPQQYTTIIVLLTGVFGGLGIVILLILCCKHCVRKHPDTGLDIEVGSGYQEKDNHASLALLESAGSQSVAESRDLSMHSPSEKRLLHRQTDRIDTLDLRTGLSVDEERRVNSFTDDCNPHSEWRGVITVDTVEVYDRLYPATDKNIKPDPQWSVDRESNSVQNSLRSRPSPHLILGGAAAGAHQSHHGSRRTLQSSLDSSVCADNRSEITVIEVGVGDQRVALDTAARSASQETDQLYSSQNRHFLSAFRPVPQRRQSTQTELSRPMRERTERLIKSQDDTLPPRLRKQSEVQDEESYIGYYSAQGVDHRQPLNVKQSTKDSLKLKALTNNSGSNHSLRQERIDRLERSDLSLTHYHEPLSPDEPPPTQGSKHMAPVKQASQSSRSSDHSYKQLWKLRSTLEDDDFDDGISVDESGEKTITEDYDGRSEGVAVKNGIVCNVVYTSFESDNSVNFTTDNDSQLAAEDFVGGDNLLHPPEQAYVSKRQNFQKLLKTRGKKYLEATSSTEKSFDSFDTTTTDGARSSESSRVEFTTTSFESSTTNDSDSHGKRHQKLSLKDDSGYKSTDTPTAPPEQNHIYAGVPSSISFAIDKENDVRTTARTSAEHSIARNVGGPRTASKKRRDFQSRGLAINARNVITSCSSFELDTTDSNPISGDSFDETGATTKYNIFFKFFHSHSRYGRRRQPKRDYSVDEKTDALFREFTRYDPSFETMSSSMANRPRYNRSSSSPLINAHDIVPSRSSACRETQIAESNTTSHRSEVSKTQSLIPNISIHSKTPEQISQITSC